MQTSETTLVYDPRACFECGIQLDIRNQSGLCRRCYARSLAQKLKKPSRHCRQCGKRIEQRNKTGLCRRCWEVPFGSITHKPRPLVYSSQGGVKKRRRIKRNEWTCPQVWLLEIRIPSVPTTQAPKINAVIQKFQRDLEGMKVSEGRNHKIKVIFCLDNA